MTPSPMQTLIRQEVQIITQSRMLNAFVSAKDTIEIRNWNVRTLNQDNRIKELVTALKNYELDIFAVTDTKIISVNKLNLEGGMTLLVSGREDEMHYRGFDLLMRRSAVNTLTRWGPIDELLFYAKFKSNHRKLNVFVCYALTNSMPDEKKNKFYERLKDLVG